MWIHIKCITDRWHRTILYQGNLFLLIIFIVSLFFFRLFSAYLHKYINRSENLVKQKIKYKRIKYKLKRTVIVLTKSNIKTIKKVISFRMPPSVRILKMYTYKKRKKRRYLDILIQIHSDWFFVWVHTLIFNGAGTLRSERIKSFY